MRIVIVGGGTTGWLVSFILSKTRPQNQYINVSSSSLGIIGVGEGTTGVFRSILTDPFYGINEFEFVKETKAMPKLGIHFKNWTEKGSSFISPLEGSVTSGNFLDTNLYSTILNDCPIEYSAKSSYLALNNKTNFILNKDTVEFYEYGMHSFHIDTHLTSNFFKRKSIENNVSHVDSIVKHVNVENQIIKSIFLDDGTEISGDLFIDCSGFRRVLSKSLNQKFVSSEKYLHVNAGLTFSLDKEVENTPSTTQAIAMNSGWIFEIPKQHETGRGYIFNKDFASEETLIKELESYYGCSVTPKKTIDYMCGTLDKFYVGNCLSVGLSSCFVEPLQATSIHCSVVQITDFIRNCLTDDIKSTTNKSVLDSYNQRTKTLYDDVVDFVSMHYTGGREDTSFWKHVKYEKELSPKVEEILDLSHSRLSRWDDWNTYYGCMNQIIWSSSLAGLGHYKKDTIQHVISSWNLPLEYTREVIKDHVTEMNKIVTRCSTANELKKFLIS